MQGQLASMRVGSGRCLFPEESTPLPCAAYYGLEADMLPYTDSRHVIRSPHRDVPTRIHSHSDLAALPSGGEDRYTSRAISIASKPYGTHVPRPSRHAQPASNLTDLTSDMDTRAWDIQL